MDFIHYKPAPDPDHEMDTAGATTTKQFAAYPPRRGSTATESTISPSTKSPSIVLDFIHYVPPDADGKPNSPIRETPVSDTNKPTKSDSSSAAEEPEETEGSTRPRLTKEQVNALETHFLDSPKPTTATKKQLAVETGLTIQRVGNWFQNRRAKAKQQKKWEDLERKYSLEVELSGRRAQEALVMEQQRQINDGNVLTPRRAKSSFTLRDQANMTIELPPRPEYANPSEAAFASLERCRTAALMQAPGVLSAAISEFSSPVAELPQLQMGVFDSNVGETFLQSSFPPSAFSDWGSSRATSVAWTPAVVRNDPFDSEIGEQVQVLPVMPENAMQQQQQQQQPQQFIDEQQQPVFQNPFVIPALPSRLREMQIAQEKEDENADPMVVEATSHEAKEETLSATQPQPQGPIAQQSLMSPPPNPASLSLAARRKRPRPAAIGNAALRSHSFMGTFPASPNSKPALLGPPSPMRRIKSAGTALNPRNRVHKAGSITPSQRSPLLYSTFKEAAEGIMAQIARPATSSSSSSSGLNACYAPPTPLSPPEADLYSPNVLPGEPMIPASPHHTLIYNPEYPGSYVSATLRTYGTPPTTPFDREPLSSDDSTLHSAHFYPPPSSPWALSPLGLGGSGGYGLTDDALISPMFQTFPDMIHMPQPVYVSPLSSAQGVESELATSGFAMSLPEGNSELYDSPQPTNEHLSPQMQQQHSQGSLDEKAMPQVQNQHHQLQHQLQQQNHHHHHQGQPMLVEADASTFGMHPLMHVSQGAMF